MIAGHEEIAARHRSRAIRGWPPAHMAEHFDKSVKALIAAGIVVSA